MSPEQLEKNLKTHDDAFLNSILAYGIYSDRQWTLYSENVKSEKYFLGLIDNAKKSIMDQPIKKAYELYLSFYNRETFEGVKLNIAKEADYYSHNYGYSTKFKTDDNGQYEALNNSTGDKKGDALAKAGVLKSKNEDGTYTIHLTFRGTDTKARPFMDFFKSAYLDMSAYYDAFKPLEGAVLDYAKDPANKIRDVHVSGHSLGGSMVQEFFNSREVQKSGLDMKGFTFGAPGSKKNRFYGILPGIYHTLKHQKFLELGKAMLGLITNLGVEEKIDSRITQYTHSGDLIPKVSVAAYGKSGNHIPLQDRAHYDIKENFILTGKVQDNSHVMKKNDHLLMKIMMATQYQMIERPKSALQRAFTFQSHDMLRYVLNLNSTAKLECAKIKDKTPEQLTPRLAQFAKYRERFEQRTHMPADNIIASLEENNKLGEVNLYPRSMQSVLEAQQKIRQAVMLNTIIKDITNTELDVAFVSAKSGLVLGKA